MTLGSLMSNNTPQRVILLVDDEPLVRMGTAALIEELDFQVVQASTGSQALQLLDELKTVEILITDFRMPDLDGMELIARAKELQPDLRAVLMTGYAANDARFAELESPRLAKPFGISDLEQAIEQSR